MYKPLLSILVPTRNRVPYAINCISSLARINSCEIEIIVSDNSDHPELRQRIDHLLNDSRIKYIYTPPPLSSIGNFNIAIENSSGEYLCMIGDDDTVNPEIVEAASWAKENGIDCVTGALAANYRWAATKMPDTFFSKMTDSTLVITPFSNVVNKIDLKSTLERIANNGATYYLDFRTPKLYHGIAKRSLFEKSKEITGNHLGGLSPDIYATVMLCGLAESAYYVDYPLTIPGVCPPSSSVQEGALRKNNSRELVDAPHFKHRGDYIWSSEVPRIYCAETIWADSALAAMRDFDLTHGLRYYNRTKLYAYIITADRSLLSAVIEHARKLSGGRKSHLFIDSLNTVRSFVAGPVRRFLHPRATRRLMVLLKLRSIIDLTQLPTVLDAEIALTEYLRKNKLSFARIASKFHR